MTLTDPQCGKSGLPVSFNQERQLLSEECARRWSLPNTPSHLQLSLHLCGPLDPKALQWALDAIIRRHDTLRASFWADNSVSDKERSMRLENYGRSGYFESGLYTQTILGEAIANWRELDFSDLESEKKRAMVRRIFAEEVTRPFDYSQPPLIRAALIKLGAANHVFIVVVHHLVSDRWSLRILKKELMLIYQQCVGSRSGPLPPPRIQFPEFAQWQQDAARGDYFNRSVAHWLEQWSLFGGDLIKHGELPFARKPSQKRAFLRKVANIRIESDLAKRIRSFVTESRVTPYALFLAAYLTTLRDLTKREKVALWSHFANRVRSGTEGMIGWPVNTHLIGFDLSTGLQQRSLLEKVQETLLASIVHQELPLTVLWRKISKYPRQPDARVLLDLKVADETTSIASNDSRLPNIHDITYPGWAPGRWSDWGVYVSYGREITLSANYSLDWFPSQAIRKMLLEFRGALSNMVTG